MAAGKSHLPVMDCTELAAMDCVGIDAPEAAIS
jgi:hypothetical protein